MGFGEIFNHYWDQAIVGFIAALVFYLLTQEEHKVGGVKFILKNKFVRAIYAFLIAILLVLIYSLIIFLL